MFPEVNTSGPSLYFVEFTIETGSLENLVKESAALSKPGKKERNFSWVKHWAQPNFGFGFGLGWV